MILLNSTASLEVVLAGAITTSQGVIYAAYNDVATDGSTFAPGLTTIATNSTTAVTAAAAPASGDVRQVKFLSLYNADTASMTATVRVVDNATNRILVKVALATGERLEYTDGQGFRVLAATGAEKGSSSSSGSSSDAVTALSISAGVVNIDCSLGRSFTLSLTANVTSITFSNLNGAGFATEIEVQMTQDGTGSRTVALPAAFKALGGSDTSVASAASAVTVLSAKTFDNGTTWRYAMQESA